MRVDAARIDALMDITGELIVAKNSLAHLAARAADIGTITVAPDSLLSA